MGIHATVIGNLGADGELKTSQGGASFLKLRVGTSFKQKGEELTTWVGGTVFGKRGETLAGMLRKGEKVALTGTLYTRQYEGKTYVEMNVDDVELLGKKNADGGGYQARPTATSAPELGESFGGDDIPAEDGSIPF